MAEEAEVGAEAGGEEAEVAGGGEHAPERAMANAERARECVTGESVRTFGRFALRSPAGSGGGPNGGAAMDHGRTAIGIGKLAVGIGISLLVAITGCSGKSSRDDEDADEGGGKGRVIRTTQTGVDKIDLLFMIDNSISMADKQRILAESVPVLVQRLIDPICVDDDGNPTGGTAATGCGQNQAEFSPIKNIHIGVITSSLGNHGGDVCVTDPAEMPPRNLNDQAQLVPSVRPGVYSYQNYGFLAWDPRMGAEIPLPDPHPGKGMNETNPTQFVTDFTTHVTATGERGCGYEASLEAWYRFLIDPEPINQVTLDANGQFSVRGPVNPVVLEQRSRFLRPDSLLAIIMLTDENDCSINDENGQQGWLVGRRTAMPRASDACSRPDDPNIYRCCIPCVLLDAPGWQPESGCSYGGDVACNTPPAMDGSGGHYLTTLEDSTNLRCYQQVRRFGMNLLYSWQRYVDALTQPRISLRSPSTEEVTNPIYTPGADGTPAREPGLVFLAGIIGVPWQDIATPETLQGRALRYIPAPNMTAPLDAMGNPAGPNRWDVILGDPDVGRQPTDPFMIETIGAVGGTPVPGEAQRSGANPIVPTATITPPGGTPNAINGTEQNIVNRDDLQYACIFDLVPDVACNTGNQDGCDCNAGTEEAYNRPLCDYGAAGMDGTQTHAKAYPGTRHLQVLKGYGANSIVASICPKNVMANGDPASDSDYGYNPAVNAIIERLKEALVATCLPRPLAAEESGDVPCTVVEAFLPPEGTACECTLQGRRLLEGKTAEVRGAVEDELRALSLCGGSSGVACDRYCMCEIIQFEGAQLNTCQTSATDPMDIYGYCYVDGNNPAHNDQLVADCPDTQQQIIRFLGPDVPRPKALGFIACLGGSVTSGTASNPDAGM